MMAKLDINKIGFFHVDNPSSPIESPRESLHEHLEAARGHLSDCVVALPEAFNYWPYSGNGSLDISMENYLKQLSDRFNVAFVAGLIENRDGGKLGYSSACLIDGYDLCHTLSYKSEEDGLVDYQPYSNIYNKPLLHRGVYIAALICMDASNSANSGGIKDREKAIKRFCGRVEKLKQIPKDHRLAFCIPSRMDQNASAEMAEDWHKRWLPDSVVILANAPTRTSKKPSVIRPEGTLVSCECRGGNTLRIVSWPEKSDVEPCSHSASAR